MATMSLLGLYQYNGNLFDGLKLPEGVDRETLINNLLSETAEFEVIYPNAEFMAHMIAVWSAKELHVWEKLEKTLHFNYDPISNYDRTEEWTDENTGTVRNSANSCGGSSGTDTKKVAGYNSETLVTAEGSTSEVNSTLESRVEAEKNDNGKRSGRIFGNIGVTTTQQMIEEERRVSEFNISDYIIASFKRRFCLLVY